MAEHAVKILFGQHQHVHVRNRARGLTSGTGEHKVSLSKETALLQRLHHFRWIFISDNFHLEKEVRRISRKN